MVDHVYPFAALKEVFHMLVSVQCRVCMYLYEAFPRYLVVQTKRPKIITNQSVSRIITIL